MNESVVKTQSDLDDEGSNNRKRAAVDESQLDEDEKQKLESRRAYNRQCAAKARKRSKELVAHLQSQVEELTKDKAELKRENDVMKAQLELLENQNKALMMNQIVQQQQPGNFSGFPAPNNYLHGSLLNATNSLVSSTTSTSSTSNGTNLPKLPTPANGSSNPNDLATLIARLTQQPPPPPPPQAMSNMGGADNGQLAALLSLIQSQSDPNKNAGKH